MADGASLRFAEYSRHSLELVARDAPVQFAMMQRRLGSLVVSVSIDREEPVRIQLAASPWVEQSSTPAEIAAQVSERALMDMLEGRTGLEQSIERGFLDLQGKLEHLLAFLDVLGAWLHGAVRCPSIARLHSDYTRAGKISDAPRLDSDQQMRAPALEE